MKISPTLKSDLSRAEVGLPPHDYLAINLFNSLSVFVMVFLSIFCVSIFFLPIVDVLKIAYVVSLVFLLGIFGYNMAAPKMELIREGKMLEKDLLFAMRYLTIRVKSGIPLYDAMVGVAHGNYGEVSREFQKTVKEIAGGKSDLQALDSLALRTSSPFFRRVIWQMSNNMRTGSDIANILSGITESLVKEHKILIRKYGSELNPIILLYMMFSIVIPSLGITVLVVMSSFTGVPISYSFFYVIPVAIFVLQIFFMSLIKGRRPLLSM